MSKIAVVGGERQVAGERGCGDPPVGFVILGSESVTVVDAPGSEVDVGVDDFGKRGRYLGVGNETFEDGGPACSPSRDAGTEAHLGDHHERQDPA